MAQEAHEAIRPTDLSRKMDEIRDRANMNRDHARLYDLIYKRALASQAAAAIFDSTTIRINSKNKYRFETQGSVLIFDGFMKIVGRKNDETIIPDVEEGQVLALKKASIDRSVVTLITQVLVDENDPSFTNPTKPIGPYYSEEEAKVMIEEGYQMTETLDGWRIVVPSPVPKSIVEGEIIRKMLDDDIVVIASGGGGMPVIEKEGWGLDGLEAVIDKDLASERLAEAIKADLLLILSNVDKVYLNYKTSSEKAIDNISLDELKKYYKDGHFTPGSMGPKVLAAIRFLEYGGKKVIISNVEKGWEALKGETGTHITM